MGALSLGLGGVASATGFGISTDDDAVFDQYDACIGANTIEGSPVDYESCASVLDDLGEDVELTLALPPESELSAEDKAVVEEFDQCLFGPGGTNETFESLSDEDIDAQVDAHFEGCVPILDKLSEDTVPHFPGGEG